MKSRSPLAILGIAAALAGRYSNPFACSVIGDVARTQPTRGWWTEPQSEASIAWHKERAAARRHVRRSKRNARDTFSAMMNPAWN